MPVKYVTGSWNALDAYHKAIDDMLAAVKREADLQSGMANILCMNEVQDPQNQTLKTMVVYSIARQVGPSALRN